MKQARDELKKSAVPLDRSSQEKHQVDSTISLRPLLQLQRAAGNRAVVSLLESNRHSHTELKTHQPQHFKSSQSANTEETATRPPIVPEALRSSGQPLELSTREFMEARFGHDFGKVRIHTDKRAAEAASAIEARAYTANHHIVFAAGQYAPQTEAGARLLTHELTHVVQQAAGVHVKDGIGRVHDEYERNADAVADRLVQKQSVKPLLGLFSGGQRSSGAVAPSTGSGVIQLQKDPDKPGKDKPSTGLDPMSNPAKGVTDRAQLEAQQVQDALKAKAAIKKAAESLVETGGTADDKDKAVVIEEMIKMPLPALSALKKKSVKVVVCRNSVTEIRTELKGVRPRGWPEGKTWDTVPGLNDPNNNRVIIATRNGRVPPTGDGHGAHNLVLHEVGHAVGDAVVSGGVTDPKFVAARDKDKAKLDTYEGQPGDPGVRETYAESFARFYDSDPNDAKKYPNLHAYWASSPLMDEVK